MLATSWLKNPHDIVFEQIRESHRSIFNDSLKMVLHLPCGRGKDIRACQKWAKMWQLREEYLANMRNRRKSKRPFLRKAC